MHYRHSGRYEEALICLERGVLLDPTNMFAMHTRGLVLLYLQRYIEVIGVMDYSISVLPRTSDISKFFALKAEAQYRMEMDEYAVISCDNGISLDPKCQPAWRLKIQALIRLGLIEESRRALDSARKHIPGFVSPI